jgi:hypothetical protein
MCAASRCCTNSLAESSPETQDIELSYRYLLVAVIDGFLIDHEPPTRIETKLSQGGINFARNEQLELLDTRTGEIDLAHAPDELNFDVEGFNKKVVTEEDPSRRQIHQASAVRAPVPQERQAQHLQRPQSKDGPLNTPLPCPYCAAAG